MELQFLKQPSIVVTLVLLIVGGCCIVLHPSNVYIIFVTPDPIDGPFGMLLQFWNVPAMVVTLFGIVGGFTRFWQL